MINTSVQNSENLDKVSRALMSPNQDMQSDTSILKSPRQKNVSMSSKKRQDKQSDTSRPLRESVSKSPKNNNVVSEEFDSGVDIHIEKKIPRKTNEICKSPVVERNLKNDDKLIASTISQEGNFFII